jgi:addiction module RelB/DinJ family antitoxin
MSQSSVIQVRVDAQLKEDAENLFSDLGLDIPSAIRLFLKQSIARNGIPFPLKRGDDFSALKADQVYLNNEDWDHFAYTMKNPPAANENLKKAIKKNRL